ncbi:DUF397 domain-containing protein [Spirillospora sp. NPDC052269]
MRWRKSSYSGTANDEVCVELGRLAHGVGIRDSRGPNVGCLSLSEAEFGDLIERLKRTKPEG